MHAGRICGRGLCCPAGGQSVWPPSASPAAGEAGKLRRYTRLPSGSRRQRLRAPHGRVVGGSSMTTCCHGKGKRDALACCLSRGFIPEHGQHRFPCQQGLVHRVLLPGGFQCKQLPVKPGQPRHVVRQQANFTNDHRFFLRDGNEYALSIVIVADTCATHKRPFRRILHRQ